MTYQAVQNASAGRKLPLKVDPAVLKLMIILFQANESQNHKQERTSTSNLRHDFYKEIFWLLWEWGLQRTEFRNEDCILMEVIGT